MHGYRLTFTTPAQVPPWQRWLVFSPLARIGFFVGLWVGGNFLLFFAAREAGVDQRVMGPLWQLAFRGIAPLVAYVLLVKLIEHRRVSELSLRRLIPDGALGLGVGAVLFSAVVGALWLLGSYHVTGTNPEARWWAAALVAGLGAGIGEEILCRGVLYRVVEEGLGSWIALLVSALFFGAAHLHNPGATLWAGLAIAIEAGVLLALIYLVTRSLWVCMGLHAAWNFMQGTVYGIPVSGTRADGWLVSTRSGPDWLSGGVFGAEASVVALTLCSLASVILLVVALRRGLIVPPCWSRSPDPARVGSPSMPVGEP